MCGRFTLAVTPNKLKAFFPLFDLPLHTPRYNIAPTQDVLCVRGDDRHEKPQGVFLRWGLVPWWADDLSISSRLINARAETVADKPAFREAFAKRRCLVLADGFFEWRKHPSGKGPKQPFHITDSSGAPFAFAGLWESWKPRASGDDAATPHRVESCTIITTDANDAVRPLHDRMPVVLEPRDYLRWLSPTPCDPQALGEMLRPYPAERTSLRPVSTRVNNARNDDEQCLQPPPQRELDFG